MPAPATTEAFLTCLRKSGLLEAERLDDYLQSLQEAGAFTEEPRALGERLVQDGLLTGFQARQLLQGKYRGFIIGKYRLLDPLGTGGMSRVFLCQHVTMGHLIAMKVLPVGKNDHPSHVGRFLREARAVAALNHPNIIRAHDVDRQANCYYLIMDYVEGVTLQGLVKKKGPLDPSRAAHYVAQAAWGLQHIHESGLVHRDLKPGNLLLDRQGVVKILDLGLARFMDDRKDLLTQKYDGGSILGTADYLSPEQAVMSSNVDIRSDIYSLGATLYYLLAGRAPFEDLTVAQKLLSHQSRNPDSVTSLRTDVPEGLVAVVVKMMAKDPAERYQQPHEVAEALAPWTEGPIDPPSEDEIPQTRYASGGSGSGSTGPRSATSSTRTPRRTPIPPGMANGPGSKPSGVRSLDREAVAEAIQPARPLPAKAKIKPRASGGAKLLRVLAALLVMAGVAAAVWHWDPFGLSTAPKGPGPVTAPPQGDPGAPAVTRGDNDPKPQPPEERHTGATHLVAASGPEGSFRTVHEALAKAAPGDRVVLQGPVHQEHLSLTAAPRDVTIEAAPGSSVTWSGPNEEPIVKVANVEGLRLRGLTLDGQNRIPDLVLLAEKCPGVTLENVQARNFTRSAVTLNGAAGEENRPILIRRCRVASTGAAEAAFKFAPSGNGNQFVHVQACRTDGPLQAAVALAGLTANLEIRHNRFYKAASGVKYQKTDAPFPVQVSVQGNTFFDVAKGIHFEAAPPGTSSQLVVQNNLFVGTAFTGRRDPVRRVAAYDAVADTRPAPGAVAAQWIWCEEPEFKGTSIGDVTRFFRKTFDLAAVPARAILDISGKEKFELWVNGRAVYKSEFPCYDQRVHALDVTKYLRPGRNVMAVAVKNEADPLNPKGFRTAAGLLVQLTDGGSAPIVLSDGTWKVSFEVPSGWEQPEFADVPWAAAKPWGILPAVMPWENAVWDAVVLPQAQKSGPIHLATGGNFRDYFTWEQYPYAASWRFVLGDTDLGLDPANDESFLRYGKNHPLMKAGLDQNPVGAPPER